MVLVALDTNVVDLVSDACSTWEHVESLEAMAPPPSFGDMQPEMEVEVFACYWLVALAPASRSTVHTFSDALYRELTPARRADGLFRMVWDVLVREQQQPEYRNVNPSCRPDVSELTTRGVKSKHAIHVADAIALHRDYVLTNDRQLRNRGDSIKWRRQLRVRRPSEFLVQAVQEFGAPWTTRAPWPWESIDRIRRRG